MVDLVGDDLRRVSNVIQAVENVITQCGDDDFFFVLKTTMEEDLKILKLHMHKLIHQVAS